MTAPLFTFFELRTHQLTQFACDYTVVFMRVLNNFMANLDVRIERLMAGLNHHTDETFVYALLAQLNSVAMIEVNRDRNVRQTHSCLDQLFEVDRVRVIAGASRDLQH